MLVVLVAVVVVIVAPFFLLLLVLDVCFFRMVNFSGRRQDVIGRPTQN